MGYFENPIGNKLKILDIENNVWWWKYLPPRKEAVQLRIARVAESGLIRQVLSLLKIYWKLRTYDAVITQQDSYATFVVSFFNRILGRTRCKHFVNEFMTREKVRGIYSQIKYVFLRFCLSSVHCFICSSKVEIAYYKQELRLRGDAFAFVPLATDPRFFQMNSDTSGEYVVSAGRTGRDYSTLLSAAEGIPYSFRIVADRKSISGLSTPENVEVRYNIPLQELLNMTAKAKLVVLPLQNKPISVGQSVLIQAMALGKAIIATKNAGTVDYIEHGINGLLVDPYDPRILRDSILSLLNDPGKASLLGENAKRIAREKYSIETRMGSICSLILEDS